MGDHQLASVAQQRRSRAGGAESRHAKKIKQVYNPLSLPSSSPFIISSQCIKSKLKATSHEKSSFILHLYLRITKKQRQITQVFESFPKPILAQRQINKQHPPIPSNISPRSALTKSPKPIPLPSTQKWVSCGLKASAASTLVRHPLPHAQQLCPVAVLISVPFDATPRASSSKYSHPQIILHSRVDKSNRWRHHR